MLVNGCQAEGHFGDTQSIAQRGSGEWHIMREKEDEGHSRNNMENNCKPFLVIEK